VRGSKRGFNRRYTYYKPGCYFIWISLAVGGKTRKRYAVKITSFVGVDFAVIFSTPPISCGNWRRPEPTSFEKAALDMKKLNQIIAFANGVGEAPTLDED